jgi:O-succinylbenzoic acid--CoA ligase
MTETASQVATARPEEAFSEPGTVGRPLLGTRVRVVENGKSLAASERGELVVSGPTVTPGYYDDPGANEEGFSEAGFHTGDIGYVDSDGRVWVTGRLDDRILTGGQTVDPREVSDVLREHPAVREAAVVGLASEEWGQEVGAALVAEGNAGIAENAANAVEEGAIEAFCRERLANYKLPRTIAFVERLPRTASGTIDRVALREWLREVGGD